LKAVALRIQLYQGWQLDRIGQFEIIKWRAKNAGIIVWIRERHILVEELIENKMEMVKHAEHSVLLATIDEEEQVLAQQAKLQHEWNIVGADGKALRRSKRNLEEMAKRKVDKKMLNRKTTAKKNNNAIANKTTTTTIKNNKSTLQLKSYIYIKIIKN
jgi:hypothetical protein